MKNLKSGVNTTAFLLLMVFTVLAVTSMWNDSANYDERIHLPAGYSYLTQQDMRLNPEHPPLVKDLSALPLLFLKINFPYQSPGWNTLLMSDINRTQAWQTDVTFGNDLLYYSGNDAQKMMHYGRLPIILIGLLLGFYVFRFCRELWGETAGLIALSLYSFSPTILAHTRLVTTDVAATAAFFISFYYLYKWLKVSTQRNLWIFGIVFGLALLTKFSIFLLIPILGFITLAWVLVQNQKKWFWFGKYIGGFIFALIISFLIVGAVYAFHIWNYPPQKQIIDTSFILTTFGFKPLANFNVWLSSQPYLRAFGHYLLGFLMVLQRSEGGNTTYYLGETGAAGSWTYFPVVYLIKEPLAYIILSLFAVFIALRKCVSYCRNRAIKHWISDSVDLARNNFAETGMLFIVLVYFAFSINSNLNIGVRHILPTIPFIYALTARQIAIWIKGNITERIPNYLGFWQIFGLYWKRIKKSALIVLLFMWAILTVLFVYPSFLAYFNEIAGGPDKGHRFVVDSNLDWGQDILRLAQFIEKNNIKEIKMDYFSGAPAEYYIKTAKIESYNREESQKGWLAVSATIYSGACKGDKIPCSYGERAYTWLDSYKPVAKIGYSIFVYKIE
ncbi:MAG: glycosyltransferase family 39 protein [Candidatus Azambacteria bacterium]|nr:glycosyltransferase family 39 protein [Candidatus Azambacteria bacterium]